MLPYHFQLRLRRLLPTQGRQAADSELQGRAAVLDRGHRGGHPHPQGLRGRRGSTDGMRPRVSRQREAGRGRVPSGDEVELRQLPRELDPGCHEAREGKAYVKRAIRWPHHLRMTELVWHK